MAYICSSFNKKNMNLKDKNIILTGGSSGIGKATAIALINKGAKVLITGRNKEKLEKVAAEIGAIPFQLDMANYREITESYPKIKNLLGGSVDVLINNAGIGEFATLDEVSIESFERVFSTNVFGLTLLTQEVVKDFKINEKGDIINVASTAATKGFAYGSVYAASKFALRGLTQCWQAELRKFNVRVIQVNPSEVPTAFNKEDRVEVEQTESKLSPKEISDTIVFTLEMANRGFVPEVSVWATNPK
jgi:3-oxoacyl-[acyl-carrier protein] reductase